MIVLGLDTAGFGCATAIWRDGTVVARRGEARSHGHAEVLVPMILGVLAEAGLALGDVDLYGVTVGPGAFTGLRVGLATVGGLALASGRPVLGVTSLEAVAHGVPGKEWRGATLVVALDSRRSDLFVQAFSGDHTGTGLTPLGAPAAVSPTDLAGWLTGIAPGQRVVVAGDAAAHAVAGLSSIPRVTMALAPPAIDPGIVAALAAARIDQATPDPPAPLYLRSPGVTPGPASRRTLP